MAALDVRGCSTREPRCISLYVYCYIMYQYKVMGRWIFLIRCSYLISQLRRLSGLISIVGYSDLTARGTVIHCVEAPVLLLI
jgi:hypothetical protein